MTPKETSGSLSEDWARRVRRAKVMVWVWLALTFVFAVVIVPFGNGRYTFFNRLGAFGRGNGSSPSLGVAMTSSGLRYVVWNHEDHQQLNPFAMILIRPRPFEKGIWATTTRNWNVDALARVHLMNPMPQGVTVFAIRTGLADYLESLPPGQFPAGYANPEAMAFLRSGQTLKVEWLWKGLVVDGVMLLYSGVVVWSIGAWWWAAVRRRRAVRRWNLGLCTGCGYNIQGSVGVGVCPECGCRFASGLGEGEGSGVGSVASGGADTIAR